MLVRDKSYIFSTSDQFLDFLQSRPFGFLPAFLLHRAQQHQYRNFVLLQIFQPMTAQLYNFDCRAVLLMVEICEEGQQFCFSVTCHCAENQEGNQISVLGLIQYKVSCRNLLWFVDLIDFNSGQTLGSLLSKIFFTLMICFQFSLYHLKQQLYFSRILRSLIDHEKL